MSKPGNAKGAGADTGVEYLIVNEKVTKFGQEPTIRRYRQGKFLGKGGFAKCYEFTPLEDQSHISAAKVMDKITLTKSRQKQKLISEIKIH